MRQDEAARRDVSAALDRINAAWLERRPGDLDPLLDEGIVMVFPGFSGRAEGRKAVLAGFEDFCDQARVHGFRENDREIDVCGSVAVGSFAFDLVYERGGGRYRSRGRDLWVFGWRKDGWRAVWRTMLDVAEEPVPEA